MYLKDEEASTPRPKLQLEGFDRINLKPGESKVVEFELTARQFSIIGKDDKRVIEKGNFVISVGGGQPNVGATTISGKIKLTGKNSLVH